MTVVVAHLTNTLVNVLVGLLVARWLGPVEFGRFALVLAASLVLQTLLFDWLRLAAARFTSPTSREDAPDLHAGLEASFLALATPVLTLGAAAWAFLPADESRLAGLACLAAVINGLFDFRAGLARARFADRLYGRLLITKNALAVVGTAGFSFWFGTAEAALVGIALSMGGSLLLVRGRLGVSWRELGRKPWHRLGPCLRYALPVVGAAALYLAIPLVNRTVAARLYGFGETGQFSLAWDIGSRLVTALGTALDVLLFQIAVRADADGHGGKVAARNLAIVVALLLPACAGTFLVMPGIEATIVPEAFRGPFGAYFALLLPGLFLWGVTTYGLAPTFQIAHRTSPIIAAAAVAIAADVVLLALLPRSDATRTLALAQTGALAAGAATLMWLARRARLPGPRLRDLAAAGLGTLAMAALVWPLRDRAPGLPMLGLEAALGAAVYAGTLLATNLGGLRDILRDILRQRAAQPTRSSISR